MFKLPFGKGSDSKDNRGSSEDISDEGYVLGRVLGEGSYCKVRACDYEGEEVAVKVIKRSKLSKEFCTKFLPREIEALNKVQHENIIKVHKIFNFPDKVYIFMELVEDDLLNYVRSRRRLSEGEARHFFSQLVSSLKYLHSINVAHRDLKCENIMITKDSEIKLIDFGFCRSTVDKHGHRKLSETFCGSTAYAAPEVLLGHPYNPMLYDVWSLGCVLFIMVTGTMPFDDTHVRKMVAAQRKKQVKFSSSLGLSPGVKDLIRRMLEPDVTKRISIERVAKHDWMGDERDSSTGMKSTKSMYSTSKAELVSKATQVNLDSSLE